MKSTKTAWAVTAVAVALSAFLGCNRSLAALRRQTAQLIVAQDAHGNCVAADSQDLVNTARNLQTLARRHLDPDDKLLTQLEDRCLELEELGLDPAARRDGAAGVRDRAEDLIRALKTTPDLTEADLGDLAGFETDIAASLHRMETDPYNMAAERFNRAESGFPANLLGVLVGPLATFDF